MVPEVMDPLRRETTMPTVEDSANLVDSQQEGEGSPAHEKVAELAYKLWCERGRGDGHAEADWCRAEKQLADRPS